MKMLTFDPQKRITAAQALKHPFFDGFTHNPAANVGLTNSGSNKNLFGENTGTTNATGALGSGGKLPGSRAMRIESRKGILSRKSSVNKNSFYKQKAKDTLPSKLYGNTGAGSYFNKNGGPNGNQPGGNLPTLGSGGGGNNSKLGMNKPAGPPQPYKYGGGGIGGGGIGGGAGLNSDPYNVNYQENSQGH